MAYLKFAIYALGGGGIGYALLNTFTPKVKGQKVEANQKEANLLIESPSSTKYEDHLKVLKQSTSLDPMVINTKEHRIAHNTGEFFDSTRK